MSYQLYIAELNGTKPDAAMTIATSPQVSFLFHADNPDYQQFKKDLANSVELKDAEGNQMTPEQITTFLEGLA